MTVKQQELSKAELLNRLDHRSRSRYCRPFPESLFNDLQKDALIPALERSDNAGLSPTYFATWRHFRRALQLDKIRVGFGAASRSGLVEMEGLLLTGLDDRPLPKLIDDALNSTDDEYISGRVALALMQHTMFRPVLSRTFLDRRWSW